MSSESSPEPPTDVDGYLQRAGLLADLGRYDEAAGEIGFAVALEPDSVAARIMLARVHLAADRPEQALAAIDAWADEPPNPWSAEATATAAPAETATAMPADAGTGARSGPPDRVALLVVRGLALIDLRRYADAARLATDLLATYPDDAYAQRSGAAILAGSRSGQPALNAAWRGVELAPQDAQAHLVLGLVGARLELFDLAHRAYGEALRLDPLIGEAQHDVGVIHLEQRRYAAELAVLAERATAMAPPPPPQPSPARPSRWAPQSPGSAPMDPRLERPPTPEEELRRLVLIGAGVIGLELGSVWRRLGAEVTVVEYLDRILPGMDGEIAKQAQRIFKKQGMTFELSRKVTGIEKTDQGLTVSTEAADGGSEKTFEADVALVCIGRRPYTAGLGLETVGIETDKRGFIANDHYKTGADGIWVVGDCTHGPMLAHKAEDEGVACAERIAGKAGHVNYDAIPGVVYTNPEIATVGATEEQLKEQGRKYKTGKFSFAANSRARANHETDGMVKMLADAETDELLGAHMIGKGVGEMIAELCLAIEFRAASEDVARTCHPHPTMSEAVRQAAMGVEGWTMQS